MTVAETEAAIGRKRLISAGISPQSLSDFKRHGYFPASWYAVVSDLCDEAGIECPRELFNFKLPSGQRGEAAE